VRAQVNESEVPATFLDSHRLNDNSIIARDVRSRAKWLLLVEADQEGERAEPAALGALVGGL
jgi:hypothetical protein